VDILRVMRILKRNNYEGVLRIMRQMNCPAPWHAGMAYALGYCGPDCRSSTASARVK
jgi:mannonate dehydratase